MLDTRKWILGAFLLTLQSIAWAEASSVLISVQDLKGHPNWGKEVCELMHHAMSNVSDQPANCFLIPKNLFQDVRIQQIRSQKKHHTHLRVFRDQKNKIIIDTNQWVQDDETDFTISTFTINQQDENQQKENLRIFARNWAAYRISRFHFKSDLLFSAIGESKQIKLNSKNQVVDTTTLNPISLRQAYALYANESDRQKKYLKTSLEVSAVLGFGTYLYYKNLASMRVDHDYKGLWDGVGKKVSGEAIREDDNHTAANIGHIFAGQIYYQVARNNGLSFIEATLVTFAASAAWEFLEYKEVFSLNDQVLTGWTGAVLGEVFYQMARALKNKSNTFFGRALATVFDPVGAVNNTVNSWMGHKNQDVRFGDLDISQWSKFELSLLKGRQAYENAQSEDYKGIEMKGLVLNIPDWDKPGKVRQLLLETPVAEFQFTYTKSRFGVEDFKFVTQSVLAGLHDKNRDSKNGYEYLIGVSSGFEWDQKRSGPFAFENSTHREKDLMARAHILGTTLRAIGLYKGIKFSLEMKVHADYVMVSSYALEQLEEAEGGREGLLSVVKKRGYYYGTGWSQELNAGAEIHGWQLGWNHNRTDVSNSDFQHRFEEQMTKNYSYQDGKVENKFYIKKLIGKSWAIEVAVIKVERQGSIASSYSKRTTEKRTEMKLSYIW